VKTVPQINISKSFSGKPPGFVAVFVLCMNLGKQKKNEKKWNNFGILHGYVDCK